MAQVALRLPKWIASAAEHGLRYTIPDSYSWTAGLDNCDFLPDFLRQIGCQLLYVGSRIDHIRVAEVLCIKGGELPGQGKNLGTSIEITHQFERRELMAWACFGAFGSKHDRVIGQLVHVNHMNDGTDLMQGPHCGVALEARFKAC